MSTGNASHSYRIWSSILPLKLDVDWLARLQFNDERIESIITVQEFQISRQHQLCQQAAVQVAIISFQIDKEIFIDPYKMIRVTMTQEERKGIDVAFVKAIHRYSLDFINNTRESRHDCCQSIDVCWPPATAVYSILL